MDRRAADAGDRQPMRRRAGAGEGEERRGRGADRADACRRHRTRSRAGRIGARSLPAGHPATPLLLVQAAVLNIGRGDAKAAIEPLARLDELAAAARLTPAERERVVLANALAAVAAPTTKPDVLLAKGRAALALEIDPPARRALSVLLAERLAAAGRADDAAATLGPPPHGDDAIGRYIAFKQIEMHARAGRRGPLLAEAREVLGRRDHAEVEEDPASTAVMDIALRTLLASPISDETLEVLESLGPPRERLGRAEAFAQTALETGTFRSAMATFLWLLRERHRPESAAAESRARVGLRRARRRSRGVHAHVPPARRARGPHRRQEGGGQEGSRQEDGGQEDGGGQGDDGGQEGRQGRQVGRVRPAGAKAARHRPHRIRRERSRPGEAARDALGELAARPAGRRARRTARAGRKRRPAEPGHPGRHLEAPPGRQRPGSGGRGADHAVPRRQRPSEDGRARLRRDRGRRCGARYCSATC